jgi:hypothetical protein
MRVAFCALLALAATSAHAATSFEYLYVRAHEGQASGGHAAMRFGGWIFDFQHDDGLLVPRREDAGRFHHAYRTLQNRSIEASRVEATAETVDLLRQGFERRVLAQQRQLRIGTDLDEDATLLAALRDGLEPALDVRGAGFFEAHDGLVGSPSLDALHAAIVTRHGGTWAKRRRAEAEFALRSLPLDPIDADGVPIDPFRLPVAGDSIGRRVAQALAARAAVDLFATPQRLRTPLRDAGPIEAVATRARLEAARNALLESAALLAGSRRPDWAEAFLRSAARLVALDASLAGDRWLVLDAMPASARGLPATPRRVALVPALRAEAERDLDRARAAFLREEGFPEAPFGAIEAAATRVAALGAVQDGATTLRVAPGALLPEGLARIVVPRPSGLSDETLARAAEAARRSAADYRARIEARYGYELVAHNCVTELFETVEAILAADASADPGHAGPDRPAAWAALVRDASERRLGGYVSPRADANFVPFVSSRNVRARWHVTERERLPSAREHAVWRDGSILAALREANVLTSSVYLPAESDGFFLFFTDQGWQRALRPLFGAVNLTAGLTRAGVGVLELPFDGGRGLRTGLDGALWSLPELLFANIRKGTSDYVPPALRPPTD